MGAWDDTALCTEAEVRAEVTNLNYTLQVRDGSSFATDFDNYIEIAKDQIRIGLQCDIPDLFVHRTGVVWDIYVRQYTVDRTYTALDAVLDTITDFTVLKRAAIAKTILVILVSGSFQYRMDGEDSGDRINRHIQYWQGEYEARMKQAYTLLSFDLDGDDTTTDDERLNARKTYRRV